MAMFDTASRNAARWRAPQRVETSYSANVTDQKSPRGAPGTPNAADASHTSRNDVRQALRQCAPRRRWSYYTLHYSLDTAGRQRASRVEQNARAVPRLVTYDARRPQLRRAARLLHFLLKCPDQNESEYTPTTPHRRATARHRILRMYVVWRCRMAGHTMHLRWRPGAALSSVVELARARASKV